MTTALSRPVPSPKTLTPLVTRRLARLCAAAALATFAGCGAELDLAEEDLGPYADRMPWGEYMATAAMNTVEDVARSTACSTAPIRGLSDQIVAEINCIKPNMFSSVTHANITRTSDAALPFLQTAAANDLKRAAATGRIVLNSTLRTTPQQWILYSWYQTGRCGVSLAARPGTSNHEDGLAIDVDNWSTWKTKFSSYGFSWLGSSDTVHFDYSRGGANAPAVLAFQRLWNKNNPSDRITADGVYGPQTEARIKKSPRTGFAGGPTCS